MPYAILLNELIPLDLERTARILAKARDIIYADATRNVRHCYGILAAGLGYDEAKAIADELNRTGVGVFVMDQGQMYLPEPTVQINDADCLEECLNVQDLYGRSHPLLWPNIILISLGRILQRKETVTYSSSPRRTVPRHGGLVGAAIFGGILVTSGSAESSSIRKTTEEEIFLLDIFSKAPQKCHYRIQHNAFNYDYLGPRVRMTAAENFHLLVEDLVGYAKQAYGNRGVNAYLSGEDPKKMDYNDLDHFDKENLWLLQLMHVQPSAPEGDATAR
jgi:hypothetical protein